MNNNLTRLVRKCASLNNMNVKKNLREIKFKFLMKGYLDPKNLSLLKAESFMVSELIASKSACSVAQMNVPNLGQERGNDSPYLLA